jgi:hypothetical protein
MPCVARLHPALQLPLDMRLECRLDYRLNLLAGLRSGGVQRRGPRLRSSEAVAGPCSGPGSGPSPGLLRWICAPDRPEGESVGGSDGGAVLLASTVAGRFKSPEHTLCNARRTQPMPHVILQPAGGPGARTHLWTIESGVSMSRIVPHL